ncbi:MULTISPECIES: hypothetical protein [Flavobacteriaceae]|uniref:Uncharacterized protein n=1 Tax=Algibacter mikhailovii TaxID=425498 RepID=A0A918VGJ4_9FLAO|nr:MULTISPECIES: hypothetical protein [Algibacter]GGZ94705.1 hypothetical protein GCM10007028_36200 [Algibacter mikhailovii]
MKRLWKKYKILIFPILILIGFINTVWFFDKHSISEEDFFNNAVKTSYNKSYDGIITQKFYKKEGGRDIIVLEKNGITTQMDFVYQNPILYQYLKVGDTLIKTKNSNSIVVKRAKLDTTINLTFENLKGVKKYSINNPYLKN